MKATSSGTKMFPKIRPVTIHSNMLYIFCVILLEIFSLMGAILEDLVQLVNCRTEIQTQPVQIQNLHS